MEVLEAHNLALKEVSKLDGSLRELESPEVFLSTFYLQESISSNAVENIHTTIESALEDETKQESERTSANKEVMNYRQALEIGSTSCKKYGLSSRTIREVHRTLKVAKGQPGDFRKVQNQIANRKKNGQTEIIYTPPEWTEIQELIGNWERYVERDTSLFPLIKAAISHYQFEAIHPFEDGNGRCGRILMLLQLMQDELLSFPALFLSSYLSENDQKYKRLLLEVSTKGVWWEYIEFMLYGFATQALVTRLGIRQLKNAKLSLLLKLREDPKKLIKKAAVKTVVDHIFEHPVTHAKFMERATGIHWQTCGKYLKSLAEVGVLLTNAEGRYVFYRNKMAFDALVVAVEE